jgi:hypothetical protein
VTPGARSIVYVQALATQADRHRWAEGEAEPARVAELQIDDGDLRLVGNRHGREDTGGG